ncbi:MAG: alpha-amylase family glycosyl hydrolase [Lachnospiraceae bacterium]
MKKRKIRSLFLLFLATMLLTGCGVEKPNLIWQEMTSDETEPKEKEPDQVQKVTANVMDTVNRQLIPQEATEKNRVFYTLKTDCFFDGDGDGNGDFLGIEKKFSYLNDGDAKTNTDLGVEGLALFPIMPQSEGGVTDFKAVDAKYGSLREFDNLAQACGKRDMKLVLNLPLNCTALTHPWFQEACAYLKEKKNKKIDRKECQYLNYYFFTQEPEESGYYRITGTKWYYRAAKGSKLPELNMEDATLQKEYEDIVGFWLNEGVDGFWISEKEFYRANHPIYSKKKMNWFAKMVKEKEEQAVLIAEIGKNVHKQVYYKMGYDSILYTDLSGRMGEIAGVWNRKKGNGARRYGKLSASLEDSDVYGEMMLFSNPMKERSADYFYGPDAEKKIKMAGAMYLMMSGSAMVLYGEEIGMKDGGKQVNLYAPMDWETDRTAEGMCTPDDQIKEIPKNFGSVDAQLEDPTSIQTFYRQILRIRAAYPQIANGDTVLLEKVSDNQICFLQKEYQNQRILLVFNLSDQTVKTDSDRLRTYGYDPSRLETGGILLTGTESAQVGEKLILPPYSMLLLVPAAW